MLRSDPEGRVEGWMRRPKLALFARLRASDPSFQSEHRLHDFEIDDEAGLLRFELALAGSLRGKVVDWEGRPVAGAKVTADRGGGIAERTSARTAEGGGFELHGLQKRRYHVQAVDGGRGQSEALLLDLAERSDSPELHLVPARSRRVLGRVVGPSGAGVAGAAVALQVGLPVPHGDRVATDLDGRFEVYLPTDAKQAVARVENPSGSFWSGCVQLGEDDLLLAMGAGQGGELRLRIRVDPELPPVSTYQAVVISGQGGFFTFGQLEGWRRRLGLPFERPTGSVSEEIRSYSGLASDVYTAFYLEGPTWTLVDSLCSGASKAEGTWSFLAEGGLLILDLDAKGAQKAEAEDR